MVEFAIILPLLLIILFGITELGRALYQQNMLDKATGSAVRFLSRSYDTLNIDTSASSCTTTANWVAATTDATNLLRYGDIDGSAQAILPGISVTSITTHFNGSSGGYMTPFCTITVSAKASFQPLVGDTLFGFSAFDLTTHAEERYIGE